MFRFVYSFQHLEASNAKVPMTYLGPSGRFGFAAERPFITKSNGFQNFYANFADAKGLRYTWLNLQDLGIVFKKRVIIGFRFYTYGTPDLFHIGSAATLASALFSATYAEAGSTSSAYAEVVIDFDALTTTLYINGTARKVQQNTAQYQERYKTEAMYLACQMAGGTSSANILGVAFTDYYVRDSEGEAEAIVPLGNVSPQLILVSDISANLIDPAQPASAVGNINAAVGFDASAPPIAKIDDAGTGTKLTVKLKTTVIAGRRPTVVAMFSSAIGSRRPAITWKSGSNTKTIAGDPYPLNGLTQSIAALGISNKALDDQDWSWDKINQMSLEMTFP